MGSYVICWRHYHGRGCPISGKTAVVIGRRELQPRVNTRNIVYARLPLFPNCRNLATVLFVSDLSFSNGSAAAQAQCGAVPLTDAEAGDRADW
jgi:hypothetical protein